MIINYLKYIRNLYFRTMLFKYKALRMNQINSILIFSIPLELMASANMELNHLFNIIGGFYFIYTLVNFLSHFVSILL